MDSSGYFSTTPGTDLDRPRRRLGHGFDSGSEGTFANWTTMRGRAEPGLSYRRVVGSSQVGPGDVIADRQIVTLLGSGGEGDVWEARRPDGSRCALKLVRPQVLPSPDEVRRRGAWLVSAARGEFGNR